MNPIKSALACLLVTTTLCSAQAAVIGNGSGLNGSGLNGWTNNGWGQNGWGQNGLDLASARVVSPAGNDRASPTPVLTIESVRLPGGPTIALTR